MFMKKGLVALVYVDDVLFFGTSDAIIDEMIATLKRDFDLKVEEDVFAFLGIEIIKDKKGNAISLRQSGLVDRIIRATGMEMPTQLRLLQRRSDLVLMSVVKSEEMKSGVMHR